MRRSASIRLRLSLLYSGVVFGLGAVLVALVYVGLSRSLDSQPVTETQVRTMEGDPSCLQIGGVILCERNVETREVTVVDELKVVEKATNQRALERFRTVAFGGLGGLFVVSLVVGWVLAGRFLAPVGRITGVARSIGETDLSRRIRLEGPDDELKRLADTFDAMLARVEGAFEAQRSFIHEASHELRNPLAVMRTNVEVALADPDATPEELRDALVVAGRSAERMGVLVDDLLTYARRSTPDDQLAPVDLGGVVTETVEGFRAAATARDLRLVAAVDGPLPVAGDAGRLTQALANLVANAVRLAPEGTTVTVACGRADASGAPAADGPWAWMTVTDEGPGIDVGEQRRVFERFHRLPTGADDDAARSGLGLTIVRRIALAHGGSVGLRSTPGVGSTFSIWLPALHGQDVGSPP